MLLCEKVIQGLVGKTKHYACYKNSHNCLDLIWIKFERVKCQLGKFSRSTHRPRPSNMEKIHGWLVKKKSVRIARTELYVISYAGLVFGNNIICSI